MQKYIYYESDAYPPGINHYVANISTLCIEANLLGRVALIPKCRLHKKHNYGASVTLFPDKYYDVNQITVRGIAQKVAMERDIAILHQETNCLRVQEYQNISTAENEKYPYIIRVIKHSSWWLLLQKIYNTNYLLHRVVMPAHAHISAIAGEAQRILGAYHSLHVRRGDRLRVDPLLNYHTSIAYLLKRLKKVIPAHAKLFLMTNEEQADYFKPLYQRYSVYRWTDLPPIKALFGDTIHDNFLLYILERLVWGQAIVRISTIRNGWETRTEHLYPRKGLSTCIKILAFPKKITRNLNTLKWRILTRIVSIKKLQKIKRIVKKLIGRS